ncbi:MAG: DMT family transporter [Candidatus Omnitrophota bacterium]|jgi:drug/metabolite transporter (DMT)-like permease
MITLTSLVLILASAIIHPLWNMLLKRSDDKLIFYTYIHLIFTGLFTFVLWVYPLEQISFRVWVWVVLSAVTHFFYQVYLCKAYDEGDLSLTYPIIRSSSVFILLGAFVFLREVPTAYASLGVLLILAGVCFIHQNSLRGFSFRSLAKSLKSRAMIFAGLTAFFSALYSIVDKKAVLECHPVLFFYLFFTLSGLFFLAYVLTMKERRGRMGAVLKKDFPLITAASLMEFMSYILILYAFRLSNTAYVTALRQISVVFGVIYGLMFLKEPFGKVRLASALVIFLGAFLIIVYG